MKKHLYHLYITKRGGIYGVIPCGFKSDPVGIATDCCPKEQHPGTLFLAGNVPGIFWMWRQKGGCNPKMMKWFYIMKKVGFKPSNMGNWEVSTWDMMGFYLSSITKLGGFYPSGLASRNLQWEAINGGELDGTWTCRHGTAPQKDAERLETFETIEGSTSTLARHEGCSGIEWASFNKICAWGRVLSIDMALWTPNLPSWNHSDTGSASSFPCFQRYGENPKLPRGDCHSTDDFIATSHFWPQFSDTPWVTDESPLVRIKNEPFSRLESPLAGQIP